MNTFQNEDMFSPQGKYLHLILPSTHSAQTTPLDCGAKVLVAVKGPWWLSARADRKTLTDAYLEYTHTVILVTYGEVEVVRGC